MPEPRESSTQAETPGTLNGEIQIDLLCDNASRVAPTDMDEPRGASSLSSSSRTSPMSDSSSTESGPAYANRTAEGPFADDDTCGRAFPCDSLAFLHVADDHSSTDTGPHVGKVLDAGRMQAMEARNSVVSGECQADMVASRAHDGMKWDDGTSPFDVPSVFPTCHGAIPIPTAETAAPEVVGVDLSTATAMSEYVVEAEPFAVALHGEDGRPSQADPMVVEDVDDGDGGGGNLDEALQHFARRLLSTIRWSARHAARPNDDDSSQEDEEQHEDMLEVGCRVLVGAAAGRAAEQQLFRTLVRHPAEARKRSSTVDEAGDGQGNAKSASDGKLLDGLRILVRALREAGMVNRHTGNTHREMGLKCRTCSDVFDKRADLRYV